MSKTNTWECFDRSIWKETSWNPEKQKWRGYSMETFTRLTIDSAVRFSITQKAKQSEYKQKNAMIFNDQEAESCYSCNNHRFCIFSSIFWNTVGIILTQIIET